MATEPEPDYFIYHGQHKSLALDSTQIAVRTNSLAPASSRMSNIVSPGLASHGFVASDVVARPVSDWTILNAQNALRAVAAKAQSIVKSAAMPSKGAAIHALIASVLESGDPSVAFISPVFRDESGGAVLLSSRVLIGFNKDFGSAERQHLLAAVPEGATVEPTEFPQAHNQRWQINTRDGFALLARANALAQTPGVAYAEPDMMITGHAQFVPSDPGFGDSWGLMNTGQSGGLFGFDMAATSAWDVTLGGPVIVLVLDDGVQQDHPDINQVPGKDFTSDAASNPNGGPVGVNDNHGTTVAGCISERINNFLGTTGIAPGASVASARFIANAQADGSFTFFFSSFVDALYWGQSIGAKVSNNSNFFVLTSSDIESAYTSTRTNGMVHFACTGNSGSSSIAYPASFAAVNAVGATNRLGQKSTSSQFGPGLKFMAPGQEILTTDRTGRAGFFDTDYLITSGTSYASAYAAGVAALIISIHPGITPGQVENIMASSCTDMGPTGYDTIYGYGMINAFRAVTAPVPAPTPIPTPTPAPTSNLANLSTRLFVQTGDNVGIGGFIITGTDPKKVLIRAIGPSLSGFNIADSLQDPTLELRDGTSSLVGSNNDWQSAPNTDQIPLELRPSDARESVVLATLQPGAYTAIVRGNNGSTGVGLVEVYDLDPTTNSKLANVSTRGFVETGNDVMIGGFIANGGNGNAQVLIRAIGPSLGQFAIVSPLADPMLAVFDGNGTRLTSNDNWRDNQEAAIQATGLAPTNDFESAILATLPAGNYTAIVSGKNGASGVALVEIYQQ
jgi:hypothetical protein